MTRLLIIQDPESLRLLLRPISKFLTHQVALVVVDNDGCEDGARQDGGSDAGDPTKPFDCTVYRQVAQQRAMKCVPARVATADDGSHYLREDVVCHDVCTSKSTITEGLAGNAAIPAEKIARANGVELDPVSHRVYRRGREVHLGPTEFRLLQVLLQHPDRIFTREQLLQAVWRRDSDIDERTIDVHVGRLRKALKQHRGHDPIRTIRGVGYALNGGELSQTSTVPALPLDTQRGPKSC